MCKIYGNLFIRMEENTFCIILHLTPFGIFLYLSLEKHLIKKKLAILISEQLP